MNSPKKVQPKQTAGMNKNVSEI